MGKRTEETEPKYFYTSDELIDMCITDMYKGKNYMNLLSKLGICMEVDNQPDETPKACLDRVLYKFFDAGFMLGSLWQNHLDREVRRQCIVKNKKIIRNKVKAKMKYPPLD